MSQAVRDKLPLPGAKQFVGRSDELLRLLQVLDEDGPALVYVHGIAGIGKSTLLDAFAQTARVRGATVVGLDCRTIEPTETGFLRSLATAIGSRATTLHAVSEQLGRLGSRVVLTLDTYEVFRLLDTWLRDSFMPVLGPHVRVVLAGREPPVVAWLTSMRRDGHMHTLAIDHLEETEALDLLLRSKIGQHEALRINRFARGHPLALKLAVATLTDRPQVSLEGEAIPSVIDTLTRLYLEDVDDPLTRRALSAAACVRRVTRSLLGAMLPDAAPEDAFERLRALPFVVTGSDGLILHDAVRDALAAHMRAVDPRAYRELRRSAWRQLQSELRTAGLDELWRYTADILYILENPVIRDAFFPNGGQEFVLVAAKPDDFAAISGIVERHEGPEGADLVARWWARRPESFFVARDRDDRIRAFYLMFVPRDDDEAQIESDPVTRAWWRHIQSNPLPPNQDSLFFRYLLSMQHGELPSPEQGAAWLDLKRTYMALRPRLRRVYAAIREPAQTTYAPVLQKLGFETYGTTEIDGEIYHLSLNDLGPESVDGWLARLVAEELGIAEESLLDRQARELVLGARRVSLTRLEYGVMEYLADHPGQAVSRASLIHDVWQTDYTGGSNVVEAVIRSLRKKLGDRASHIETVSGVGYRYRPPAAPPVP